MINVEESNIYKIALYIKKNYKGQSPIRIQKYLYYINLCYYIVFEKFLDTQSNDLSLFQPWNYGPIQPWIWRNFKNIKENKKNNNLSFSAQIIEIIEIVIKNLENIDLFLLSSNSHIEIAKSDLEYNKLSINNDYIGNQKLTKSIPQFQKHYVALYAKIIKIKNSSLN